MYNTIDSVKEFYEHSYKSLGFAAQRRYPNEELCRFMGRNLFSIPIDKRSHTKVLEVGCGSGANLWMIAQEGFSTTGLDLSKESLDLCQLMLAKYGVKADLSIQDMSQTNFSNNSFDFVLDIFSSNCLNRVTGNRFIREVFRLLKPKGKFFSYFPSKRSDSFTRVGTSRYLDSDTLESILRPDAAFSGQNYPFRFLHPEEYKENLEEIGFNITYLETVGRTYNQGKEYFEFIVVEAQKP